MRNIYILLLYLTLAYTQVVLTIENVDTDAGTLDIYMINEVDVAAFQFYLQGITITDISGGTADEYLDFVSYNPESGKILGASISDTFIPEGSGVLTTIAFSDPEDQICFVESGCIVNGEIEYDVDSTTCGEQGGMVTQNGLSDIYAQEVNANWGDCYCSYDNPADECGVCGGNGVNSNVYGDCECHIVGDVWADCSGECGGTLEMDCSGECGGDTVVDECGVCGGQGAAENYDCDGNCIAGLDCAGVCGGNDLPTFQCKSGYIVCNPTDCLDSNCAASDGTTGVELWEVCYSIVNTTDLSLSSNDLSGEIPSEIGNLTNLTYLSLSSNDLSGEIPPEIGSLTNLTDLRLYNNELSGEIPSEIGQLTSLTELSLSYNDLSGEIPPEIGSLTNLTDLHLSSNELSGEIPSEIGSLTNLTYLNLSSNELSGEIPSEIGSLTNLTYLNLRGNQLTGEIPPEIGSLTNLTYLNLRGNQLTGEIPSEIEQLTNLTHLYLSSNELSGEIPSEIGNLTNLKNLDLSSNELSGEIPSEIGQLTSLTELSLYYNQLTGEIPSEIGQLTSLTELSLYYNQLTGEIPVEICNQGDSTPDLSNNQLCPPYPECLTEEEIGEQGTSECCGGNMSEGVCDCDGSVWDCQGICDGDGINSNVYGDCECHIVGDVWADCSGECGGTLEMDCSGECGGTAEAGDPVCANITVEIENVNIVEGTLDIYMTNQAGCSYCSDLNSYYNQDSCESYGNFPYGATWVSDSSIDEATCEIINGVYFDGAVAGFEFYLQYITITDISGGTADEYLDFVSYNPESGKIVGASFLGGTIPAGSDILIQVTFSDFADSMICIEDAVFSDASPQSITVSSGDCYIYEEPIYDCTDEFAENYNPDATVDDGSCFYCDSGDVNCDGSLNVLDIVIASYIILDNEYDEIADMNEDGEINILDLVIMVNLVLFGDDGACTDIDGNVYETVQIGDQLWMAENLKVTHYNDSTLIPTGYSNSEWAELQTGAYAVYDDDPQNAEIYGNLYNWYTVDDNRGLCMEGWHVPSNEEWLVLTNYLAPDYDEGGGYNHYNTLAGGMMKSKGTVEGGDGLWVSPNTDATNESGFSGLPAGFRDFDIGEFHGVGSYGSYQSSTYGDRVYDFNSHWLLQSLNGFLYQVWDPQTNGYSVRCLKD